jgi:hypothetical protein
LTLNLLVPIFPDLRLPARASITISNHPIGYAGIAGKLLIIPGEIHSSPETDKGSWSRYPHGLRKLDKLGKVMNRFRIAPINAELYQMSLSVFPGNFPTPEA